LLEGKIWSPQCVHTWANGTGNTKCLKSSTASQFDDNFVSSLVN
jgi:hypothetical protein